MKKQVTVCLLTTLISSSAMALPGWGGWIGDTIGGVVKEGKDLGEQIAKESKNNQERVKKLDPTNRNSEVRKSLRRADPTKNGRYQKLSDFDPFNKNSALRESSRKIDQERLHIFDKWLTPAGWYIAFLEMQGGLRPLPPLVREALAPYYDFDWLGRVRIATNTNTIHGQAITFGYNIYFPYSMDFIERYDLKLLIHELEHVSQYRRLGGVQAFLLKYFPQSLIATFNYGRIKRGISIHDDIYIEREAVAKESIIDDSHAELMRLVRNS